MVSNGYITREAFHDSYDHIDAANIDLKGLHRKFLLQNHPHFIATRARNAAVAKTKPTSGRKH